MAARIQARKKRTDRSYLPTTEPPPAEPVQETEATDESPETEAAPLPVAATPVAATPVAATPVAAGASAVAAPRPPGRVPSAVRAIQQQGVRKRGEIDLHELAVADTRYAMHELRRIAIFAALVIVTIVVLAIVMR
jgi:hypothetical protein